VSGYSDNKPVACAAIPSTRQRLIDPTSMEPFFILKPDRLQAPSSGHGGRRSVHQTHQEGRAALAASHWPEDLLTLFGLRMARHGMSISRTQMCSDSAYAQQQIACAREMDDTSLHKLADRLMEIAGAGAVPTPITAH